MLLACVVFLVVTFLECVLFLLLLACVVFLELLKCDVCMLLLACDVILVLTDGIVTLHCSEVAFEILFVVANEVEAAEEAALVDL